MSTVGKDKYILDWLQSDLDNSAKEIGLKQGGEHSCFIGTWRIAIALNHKTSTMLRKLKSLEALGLVVCDKENKQNYRWRLVSYEGYKNSEKFKGYVIKN